MRRRRKCLCDDQANARSLPACVSPAGPIRAVAWRQWLPERRRTVTRLESNFLRSTIGQMAEQERIACRLVIAGNDPWAALVDDERKKSARNEHFGTMTAAHDAGMDRMRPRRHARVIAASDALVTPRIAVRLHLARRQRAFVPVDRRPARSPVLGQDYGRRPHRCLQSGSITSRRP